jgi:Flp pilus assembly CpaF family ATPase
MMTTDTGGASDARLKMPGHAAFYTTKTQQRMLSMLKADMGAEMWEALHDPGVTEVSANSDGTVWVDRIGQGRVLAMESVAPERIYSILTIVADAKGEQIGDANPSFDALVPGLMFRFVGTLPPLTPAPSFTIRKRPRCSVARLSATTSLLQVARTAAKRLLVTPCFKQWRLLAIAS